VEQAGAGARPELARAAQAFATCQNITVVVQNGVVADGDGPHRGTAPGGRGRRTCDSGRTRRPGRSPPGDRHALTGACATHEQEAPGQAGRRDRRPIGAARYGRIDTRHSAAQLPVVTARAVATGNERRTAMEQDR
jgi:hypothetical protein